MAGHHVKNKKKIAIVGAGCSGLTAIKCCLDEGLEPVCLEKSSDIGGLWNYSPNVTHGSASIYNSLVINTSKYMMMFSDFPPPDDFPPFLTHSKVLDYFRLYAQHFRLTDHIKFNTEVRHVTKTSDYDITGRWNVTFNVSTDCDGSSTSCRDVGDVVSETFDGVMICTGHHSVPYLPDIPGLHKFQGTVLHSHSYKDAAAFQGKRVVILGLGNSAVDIACDLAKIAQQVFLSSRRGAWIVPRTAFWGLPADMLANSRVVFTLPYKLLDWCVQLQANFRIDHATYGLRPAHGVLNCHPTINDELPIHLVSGRVKTRPSILSVEANSVRFDDHTVCSCDVIILATGYEYRVDIVDEKVFKMDNNRSKLYKYVFPPHLPHPTLAVIGLIQAIGAVMPVAEIQCRWFARIMTETARLPSKQMMLKDIRMKEATMSELYVKSQRHTLQTFWIDYMDQVASQIGARPNLWKMLFSDPELAIKCYLGPCLPAQYRLVGPGSWAGARTFILSALCTVTQSRSSCNISSCGVPSQSDHPKLWKAGVHYKEEAVGSLAKSSVTRTRASVSDISLKAKTLPHDETGSNRGPHTTASRRIRPDFTTLVFYTMVMVICCLAWLLSAFYGQTGSRMNVLGSVVGRNSCRTLTSESPTS